MSLRKWIENRAVNGIPTFSVEDVRQAGLFRSEQIMQNDLYRLCKNKTISNVYKGFYVIYPVEYKLKGFIPPTYFINHLMAYLNKPYYISLLSAAERYGVTVPKNENILSGQFYVTTIFPRSCLATKKNQTINWFYSLKLPETSIYTMKSETGVIRVSNPLLTATDIIRNQQHLGEMNFVTSILKELIEKIDVSEEFLRLYPYVNTTIWQRLGFVLDKVLGEQTLSAIIYATLKEQTTRLSVTPLNTKMLLSKSKKDKKWNVLFSR